MPLINPKTREIHVKLVYCGPFLSGKTTNIRRVYESLPGGMKSELQILPAADEKTMFFDYFSVALSQVHGMVCRFLVYGVAGHPAQMQARRMVLRGADGIVFVADSAEERIAENAASLADVKATLIELDSDLNTLPLIVQLNKRDLPQVASVERLAQTLPLREGQWFEAVATDGVGVVETFRAACGEIVRKAVEQVQTLHSE